MKKVFLVLVGMIMFIPCVVNAKEKVKFSDCVDGDTAKVILNNEEIKIRFLAVDTPETKNTSTGVEAYGPEASDFTCNALKNASIIEVEYDENSDKTDKYGRHLVWVFVDSELLQTKLVDNGLAEVAYLYGNYKYTDILESAEDTAKTNKIGIWGNYEETIDYKTYFLIGCLLVIFIIGFIVNADFRKKMTKSAKRKIKKRINNELDDLLK